MTNREPFFVSVPILAGLLQAAARWTPYRRARRRLEKARRAGQKSVRVQLDEFERLIELDRTDAMMATWTAAKPLADARPDMGPRRRHILERAIEDGADVVRVLRDLGAHAWDDQDRRLSSDDGREAVEYNAT